MEIDKLILAGKISTENTKILINNIMDSTNFEEIKVWDLEAQKEIERLQNDIGYANKAIDKLNSRMEELENNYEQLSFFYKLFKLKKEINDIINATSEIRMGIYDGNFCIEKLQLMIDLTPNNDIEAKETIAELKLLKKELLTKKRAINLDIREVNRESRIENSNVSNQIFLTTQKIRRIQRIPIRMEKEESLATYEDQRLQIDKQINEVELMLNWIEKIKFNG